MTGQQARAARRMLGWSRVRLGARCQMHPETIRKFEAKNMMPQAMFARTNPVDRLATLQAVFEAAGVVFTDGEEPGVKLRKVET